MSDIVVAWKPIKQIINKLQAYKPLCDKNNIQLQTIDGVLLEVPLKNSLPEVEQTQYKTDNGWKTVNKKYVLAGYYTYWHSGDFYGGEI